MNRDNYPLIIVGAGPVGLVLAHLLGRDGVEVLILEGASQLSDEPRAVGLDPESLRTLQSLDMLGLLEGDITHGMTGEYINGEGTQLFSLTDEQPGALGYANLASFDQPALVAKLAAALERYPHVELCFEHTLLSLEQTDQGVFAQVQQQGAASPMTLRADYLVGCDGGRSTTRRELGIAMQGESNPLPWLVVDTRERDTRGPKNKYRFFCDPARPGMFLQTPHNTRRWEWMLMPGEDREELLQDEKIHSLLSPHVDIDGVEIFRRRVYDFHAIIAERFQRGRVFLAGDAAHMTPPFAGQGLNSGIRDVANLAWKLVHVLRHGAPPALLDSYESEREPHARELIDIATALGQQIQPIDPEAAAARDAMFAELNKDPQAMQNFTDTLLNALLDRHFSEGAAVGIGEEYLAARMLSQPRVRDEEGAEGLLDDYMGSGFVILGYNCHPEQELDTELATRWREKGANLVGLSETGQSGCLVVEPDTHLAELFSGGSANMVLLRPDRFCLAAFDAGNAQRVLKQAGHLLGL